MPSLLTTVISRIIECSLDFLALIRCAVILIEVTRTANVELREFD
jgi:hypothetical protein